MQTQAVRWLIVLLVLSGSMGISVLGQPVQAPGIHMQIATLEGGAKLRYTIAIPDSFATEATVPLVLALHYGDAVTPFFGSGFLTQLVKPALEGLGAIVVPPTARRIVGPIPPLRLRS